MKYGNHVVMCALTCLLFASPLLASDTKFESYFGGQFGTSRPSDFSSIDGSRALSGQTVSDLKFSSSYLLGAKAGFFLPKTNWLGLETELYHTSPHLKAQGFTATGSGGSASGMMSGTSIGITTWAFNVLARYPGEKIQPYVGVGFGALFPSVRDSIDTNNAVGLNALGGVRFFLTNQLAVFGEYKYTRATLSFTKDVSGFGTVGLEGSYVNNFFVAGLSVHFR